MSEENTKKSESAQREEKILEFWRENKTFEKSLAKKSPKGHYVFYDGPPFATGQIHYGHILGSTVKDVIGRYKTMQGYYVPRKWGWDCHGLPIENIVEKELGVAGHHEIEKLGIDKFVEYARSKVLQYDQDWEKGIERIGRWVDFRGQYKTMDNTFIESVWWALSELNKKNLIYEGVRVLAYCARCETPIANSEIAMDNSYKDIPDISVYVKFELEETPGTYLLAWTTTPWTLPGNTAIAINENIVYVKVKIGEDVLILAKETLANVLKDKEYTVLGEISSAELVGKKYKPVFPYYKASVVGKNENIWKVWHADFVTTEKGSGIAHEAPAFGEDDMNLAKIKNIPWIIHVDETGRFKSEVAEFAGLKVKPKDTAEDKDAHLRTDIEVIKYLQGTGTYFDKEKIMHSYPHCMRCDTPIIYYALPSWFINITKVKDNIIEHSHSINWIPSHLKEGRFKNIVENAPDWNISRNRYWASPLPIWKCAQCKTQTFISSLEDLKNKTKKSGNKYFVMRHGQAENNITDAHDRDLEINAKLTEVGRGQVLESAKNIKDKIDVVISSPFTRAKETTEIVCEQIGFPVGNVIYDERVKEWKTSTTFEGKGQDIVDKYYELDYLDKPTEILEGGESFAQVVKRVGQFIYDVETKYSGKNILIVGHGGATQALCFVAKGASFDLLSSKINPFPSLKNAEIKKVDFVPMSHNANHELDLHRPYIDDVALVCDCGADLERIPEVLDCWFESGSMPFAQDHYPFENREWQKNNFPAGFVAEYIAQTRTWFYYTHVVSTMLFKQAPFKNVVTTGTLRAEDGEKMSKSKNNYPDPWVFIDKYGVDALRLYLMSSTLMKGEDANFSEKAVQDIASKIVGRLFNVLAFYELYRDPKIEKETAPKSQNVLDQWILERFYQMLAEITQGMELYDMAEATRPIDALVEDLSTWYLRRSRDRIKDGDVSAKQTLYFILKTIAKVLAPFAPFSAEEIWSHLKNESDVESVHLTEWPKKPFQFSFFSQSKIIPNMDIVRKIVTLGLEARQKAGIKVRQPLAKLEIKNFGLGEDYVELIKDEINVKEIKENKNLDEEVWLDVVIDEALKAEGEYRDFMRELQDKRKVLGLNPGDKMAISVSDIYKKYKIMPNLQMHMLRVAAIASVICDNFTESLPKEDIVTACLLHDMGNIIKFDLKYFPDFNKPEGFEYWQKVKDEYIVKYGKNEHEATLKIIKELQMPDKILELINAISFFGAPATASGNNFADKIVEYCDSRVAPLGVVGLEERLADLRKRYAHKGGDTPERRAYEQAVKNMEQQIFAKCKIKPEDITEESIASIIAELKNFVIK
jgi:isoleucyl-tRNA synthetase